MSSQLKRTVESVALFVGDSSDASTTLVGRNLKLQLPDRKGRRRRLTREERSQIRILSAHGRSVLQISEQLKRSSATVYKVLNGLYANSDQGNDYDFVSKEFKKQYSPLKPAHKRLRRDDEDATELTPSDRDEEVVRGRPMASTSTSVSTIVRLPPSALKKVHRSRGPSRTPRSTRPVASSSRQRTDSVIEFNANFQPNTEKKPSTVSSIDDFLANLDHNLSAVKGALEEQDLGTTQKLLAIAHWPNAELHELFKEALPTLTVAQRYMLVKGMKKYHIV